MIGPALYQSLRDIKLTTVRRAISSGCYRRSALQTFGWLAFDLGLYLGALRGVFASESAWAKLAFGLGAGCAVAFMFVWAHDAAHGALFRREWTAELLGTALMLPSMNMYRLWSHGHNRVHHGFTSYTPVFATTISVVAWRFGGGLIGVAAGVVVPFIVFNYFIALFVFLHHTHPEVPFFDNRAEWSNTIGQVYCSIVVRCSRLSELLIHNILIHVPHHVDARIPFYRLKRAYADLKAEYGGYIHEYRFRWSTVWTIFRRCKLYDFETKTWYTYREALLQA